MNNIREVFYLFIVILSGFVVGIVADYFEINRLLKYVLIAFAIISSRRLLVYISKNAKCDSAG